MICSANDYRFHSFFRPTLLFRKNLFFEEKMTKQYEIQLFNYVDPTFS